LSAKPILYVLNNKAGAETVDMAPLLAYLEKNGGNYCVIDAKIEQELSDFEGEEKVMFRKEMSSNAGGGPESEDDGINDLITESYKMLGLITFLTTGADETRAWTIKLGSTAPQAGAAIHTDFQEKFIKAEVVFWQDLIDAGSYAAAREKGLVRTEGKEYIVKDGDVIEFKV
jgi:ribosome-binding ATPase YchF (GTP1/OBG family)